MLERYNVMQAENNFGSISYDNSSSTKKIFCAKGSNSNSVLPKYFLPPSTQKLDEGTFAHLDFVGSLL